MRPRIIDVVLLVSAIGIGWALRENRLAERTLSTVVGVDSATGTPIVRLPPIYAKRPPWECTADTLTNRICFEHRNCRCGPLPR